MPKHYAILGGGISGLTLAWRLQKQPDTKVTLIEKQPRVGGWIETIQPNGYLFDCGPRSCRTKGAGIATLQLIKELGLQSEVICASPEAKKRYLYLDRKLKLLPYSLVQVLFSPLTKGLFQVLWRDFFLKGGVGHDESVAAFVERRLGRSFAETFFDPLVKGIFAGDMHQLSVRACFPLLAEMEAKHGGIVRGMLKSKKNKQSQSLSPFVAHMQKQSIFSFKKGMEMLPQTLRHQFHGELLLGEAVVAIETDALNARIRLSSGKTIVADQIISTLPASSLKSLLPFKELHQIPSASVATVHFGYRQKLKFPKGFGYLVPTKEREQILGVVFDSCVFPQQSAHAEETRFTVMVGDGKEEERGQLVEKAQDALLRHLQIEQRPDCVEVTYAQEAIPQYLVGHQERLHALEQLVKSHCPKLTLLGSSFYGVSVNDCVAQALKMS